jgi:hypothetical protein
MILCPLKIFVLSRFNLLFSKKKIRVDEMSNKLHTSIASIITDCSNTRIDIMELVASVNSVVSMLKIITKHLDNGSVHNGSSNCYQESAQGSKNISADEFVAKLKGMENVLTLVLDKYELIEEIS